VRDKSQEAAFFSAFGPAFNSYVDTEIVSYSLTPRIIGDWMLGGLPLASTTGIDFHFADYESDRQTSRGDAPIHRYEAEQQSLALYSQNTLALGAATDLSVGARIQHVAFEGTDTFDVTAPGASGFDAEQPAVDSNETEYAFSIGIDQRLTDSLTAFGRMGRSFRTPTVDERVKPFTGDPLDLEIQTSQDVEAGLRYADASFSVQSSVYVMDLEDEIHFNPATFVNENLDPTRRYGWEISADWRPMDRLRFSGALAYTRAEFRDGPNEGNEVPLVADWTASLTASYDILRHLTLTSTVSYVGEKRMDNDEANFQPKIDDYVLVDVGVRGEIGRFFYAATINNLFDEEYFNYAVASASTFGTYNAYPLPGRTYLLRAGVTF
jgi:iron complex outermembrane receptor protein